jgi:hypothetical protein
VNTVLYVAEDNLGQYPTNFELLTGELPDVEQLLRRTEDLGRIPSNLVAMIISKTPPEQLHN